VGRALRAAVARCLAAEEDVETLEAVLPGEAPTAYVQRVTALKLEASLARLKRRRLPNAPVLCADTTVALGRRILGKPADEAEAARMLADLAGQQHRVLTAVAVGKSGARGDRTWAALSTSWVTFEALSAAQIRRYVDSGEPMGKAGAYGIQGARACGSATSAAVIRASWACPRTRPRRCCSAAVFG
jgi:septum formation protein